MMNIKKNLIKEKRNDEDTDMFMYNLYKEGKNDN